MRIAVTSEHKALDNKSDRSNAGLGGNAAAAGKGHRRSASHSDAVGAQPMKKLARVSAGGLRRPVSSDSLQSLEAATPKTNETISSPFAQQGMGALAACLLAGSCVHDMVEDPELGMLLVSGHADVLSAKICGLPRGLQQESLHMGAREAPEVSSVVQEDGGNVGVDTPNRNAKPNGAVDEAVATHSTTTTRPLPEKKARVSPRALRTGSTGDKIVEFLRANSSPKADEASCLASSSVDEAPKIRITPVTRYLRRSGYTKANLATTNEILGSLEEDGLIVTRGRQNVSRRTAQRTPSLS